MKNALSMIAICMTAACAQIPPAVHSAPTPTPEQLTQIRATQTRVIRVPIDSVFPKVIDVLMDNDYLVRSADAKLGFVSFYQKWTDTTQKGANITQEGAALFTRASPGSTQVRVMLTGGWQQLQPTGGGEKSTVFSMVGAVAGTGADEYTKLLDLLQAGLAPPPK
jgi:hypothetical protein